MKKDEVKNKIDFSDIELISNYLDGKIDNKELNRVTEKLRYNSLFRGLYLEASEFLKDLKYKNFNKKQ